MMKIETLAKHVYQQPAEVIKLLAVISPSTWAVICPDYDVCIKVKMKKVRNLRTGIEVEIPVNTPLHMDPSSETYHSM